jgi:hypothetical protein
MTTFIDPTQGSINPFLLYNVILEGGSCERGETSTICKFVKVSNLKFDSCKVLKKTLFCIV